MNPMFSITLGVVLGVVLVGAGCDDNCIDRCPTPAALTTCVTLGQAVTVDALLADPEPAVGARVVVSGRLEQAAGMCTQLGCADGCCNTCSAELVVAGATGQLTLTSSTRDLVCSGDDARVCCPLATGVDVVVQGRLERDGASVAGPTFRLFEVEPCAP